MNIQEWCEYCSEVSYFRQVIPNILSFNNSYLSLFCTHDKVYCELCDKRWSSYLSKNGQDCYQFFSGWVKSTLTKKSISILNLPWWDNCNKCLVCELELKYIHQHSESYYQKWCSNCCVIYTGCRYCLTTNIIFGITDQSQCMKCKRILFIIIDITNMFSGNYIIDEFLASTIFDNNEQHSIADYMNNNTNIIPFEVYKFIIKHLRTIRLKIKWIPYSQITNLRKIAEGGFSIVHKTTLVDGSSDRDVAIKKLRDSQYFLDELKSFCQLNKAYGVIMCYGITQDPVTEEYMLIMDYAEGGDLHSYLKKNFINITWNDKLNIIEGISFGEMSDSSSNSNGGSFINCEKESTLKKIAELKKKIMKLENTSMKKEKTKRKSNQKLVDKESFAITNKTKGLSNQSRLKDKSFNNKSNNKSQPTLSEEDDTEFSSDEPKQPIFKKKNINYQKIPSFLHIPKRIWHGYMESMRLIVAEKLYHLFSTIEYRDMPIIEINKCIDKFCKKNPSFPETVSDWAEREMICQHINYRRSILNLSEMHKTNISVNKAKI
ncbi:hypothetical protein RirG_270770 [Rhizophagus irregularis DAOM 197198w]|uniref:Serine-threonine/tyrosine-protein kinase catalytic domain-containing protein n=1 Tax=Rhizophagus irregularis (strain DAOM 197198w) TaxID=1432141 RepID=A0A015I9I1_RHIIW|nr:hypothetical protein RirG_270770 [Rhizophagus irregularis DAOM 197198w]